MSCVGVSLPGFQPSPGKECDVGAEGNPCLHAHAKSIFSSVRVPSRTEVGMLFLVVAFLILAVVIGSAAYLP
ncbi:hypothetical protein QFZ24_009428 [Streptomyces phaeochromogenes]|nr:hypothetical protein [Streptomyces phaeochromogenes]